MFKENTINTFLNVVKKHENRNAFCIANQFYTYKQFAACISKIQLELQSRNLEDKNIGLIENDDLETYASIFALWLQGMAYVPISPDAPLERNEFVIREGGITTVMDSSSKNTFQDYNLIKTSELTVTNDIELKPKEVSEDELVYILFTSGTTGRPKGVPISRSNLSTFVEAYKDLNVNITSEDKCLQMFNLTFDLSVISYLLPLLKGACLYTIPKDAIKYSYAFELLDESDITITMMVPSMLQYLRPYFDEMEFPQLRYSMFCGEALDLKLVEEWNKCVPNATIINTYGPTEHTVICTFYKYIGSESVTRNGVISIGKVMGESILALVDENDNIVANGEEGELCLGGGQLNQGYWNNEEKNKEVFFTLNIDGEPRRMYRSGDLCVANADGNLMYLGRIDFQTKIQGFRVELSGVEFRAKEFLDTVNAVCIAIENMIGNNEIGLVIESNEFDTTELFEYLKSKLPPYMIPTQLKFTSSFPLNTNGKIDRKELKKIFIK